MTAGALGEPVLVGPYRLVNRLGEGGMGVVHLALDPQGRAVALKVLRSHVASDPDARRRLAREVQTLQRVRHPNVAEVVDADIDAAVPYLVTSFVPGRSIDEHVREHGPLAPEHVAHVGRRIAGALEAIHRVGVVHRDLKPANVMLLDGEPVVIDFGIAHMVDETRITMTGLVMGTPGYLSPEIVDGQPVTAATDWWGWGATLAFAASGRPPFGTGPATVVLDRVRRGACDLSGVDARLAGVIAAALVVDPARRAPAEVLLEGLGGLGAWTPWRPPAARSLRWGGDGDAHAALTVPDAGRAALAGRAGPPASRNGAAETSRDADAASRNGAAVPDRAAPAGPRADSSAPTVPDAVRPAATPYRPAPSAAGASAPNPSAPTRPTPPVSAPAAPPVPSPVPPPALRPGSLGAPGPLGTPPRPTAVQPAPNTGRPEPASDPQAVAAQGVDGAIRIALFGSLVAVVALAAVVPGFAVVLSLLWVAAMRTVDRSVVGLLRRRYAHGPRPSDSAALVAALPWRVVTSLGVTVLAALIPLLMGVSAAFLGAAAVQPSAPHPNRPGPLMAGMLASWLAAWWGPGGSSLRRGTRLVARSLVRGRVGRVAVFAVLGLVVLACALVASDARRAAPDWSPLRPPSVPVSQLSR